jgi:HEAT repeat protein
MEDERWIVRHAAIRSLRHADAQEAESQLLQHASRTADAYDLSYVNEALASIGTKRSAPYLSSAARSRKEHVASSALHALSMIAGRAYLPLYIQLLETGRRAVKWGAMVAVAAHGDATAIPAVLRRISRILAKKRTIPQFPLSDLSIGVTFLHQFRGSDPRVDRFFDRILPRKLEYLIGDEPRQILGLIHGQVHQGAREDP